ncbi:hypothetical protein TorRG33x02_221750 [Trema orientale]|uniref:Uncharacterized protein n=1 Tax=Trema orientale TaxID=63057 RepID=A0A2P5E931_TREOI|nr:hypothetical protein TorRG33x02_221750 [Trema orientale]
MKISENTSWYPHSVTTSLFPTRKIAIQSDVGKRKSAVQMVPLSDIPLARSHVMVLGCNPIGPRSEFWMDLWGSAPNNLNIKQMEIPKS